MTGFGVKTSAGYGFPSFRSDLTCAGLRGKNSPKLALSEGLPQIMTQVNQDVSDVELAKRVKEIKGVTSKENFEVILRKLVPNENIANINRIINSLSQEDDFATLCKMLECCASITPLNQTPITNADEITPDFQATFHPGSFFSGVSSYESPPFNCMIEVKSTEKLKFKCSRTDIDRRKRFADRYGMPLIYAIRFTVATNHAFWVLVTADDLYKKNRIDTSDYVSSIGHLLFDNYSIMTNSSFTLVRRYSKTKEGLGETRQDLGGSKVLSWSVKRVRYIGLRQWILSFWPCFIICSHRHQATRKVIRAKALFIRGFD
ncbi:hypothetical protein [Pseudomonas sp. REB1044]|uniref:hypothetical protein n=1 Tax=Pseudomonas sp. REB1044 TaxID=2675224 RepID=UPI00315C914F